MSTTKKARPFKVGDRVSSTENPLFTYIVTKGGRKYASVRVLADYSGHEFHKVPQSILRHID